MTRTTAIFPLARNGLAALALGATAALAAGIVADVRSFDQTRGGYEAPFTSYTGTPIDWSLVSATDAGMRKDGHVVDVLVDCTHGMMHFDIFGLTIPFRTFSERALVVHRPREACADRGFEPQF